MVRLRRRRESAKRLRAERYRAAILSHSGVGYLITAGVVRLLKVDRTLMRQIQSDLEKRRSNYSELNEYRELKTSEHVRKA